MIFARLSVWRAVALAAVTVIAFVTMVAVESRADAATPAVSSGSGSVDAGQTTSVTISLSDAPAGLAGFDILVSVADPGVAEITAGQLPAFGLTRDLLNSSSEIRLSAVDLSVLIEVGAANATLATVDVLGLTAGSSAIEVQVLRFDDEDGFPMSPQTLSGTITVLNVTPTVDVGPDSTVQKRDTFTRSGSIVDGGTDSWTATVDYGDGSGVQPLTLTSPSFSLSHAYTNAGAYTVTVTVTDSAGAVGSDSLLVEVTFTTLPGQTSPARDLDGDGRAEDANGNGDLDFADILAVFNNLDSAEVQGNASDFDYNGNGLVDMADIVDLFDKMIAAYGP